MLAKVTQEKADVEEHNSYVRFFDLLLAGRASITNVDNFLEQDEQENQKGGQHGEIKL